MAKNIVNLPQELIVEILLRLPVKSVLNCRCVCKSWLFLISNPNFATSHFQLAASPTHKLLYLASIPPKTITIDFNASLNNDSSYASLRLDFWRSPYCPKIGGSCRGFLLLQDDTNLYLWNPSTGVHKQIPASPLTISSFDNAIIIFMYGLAYDSSMDDYLVVLGSFKHDDDYEPVSNSTDLEIFSVRANKWKQIHGCSHLPYINNDHCDSGIDRVGLFLNDAIHWLVHNHETRKDVIITFDLRETRMSEIALPDDFYSDFFSVEFDLLVYEGLIGAWMVDIDTVNIWVMQEYAVHSSWIKTFKFCMRPSPYFLICFTNCGDMVGSDHPGALLKFNDKGQLLERNSYHRHNRGVERSHMVMYTESLLSLPGFTEQA